MRIYYGDLRSAYEALGADVGKSFGCPVSEEEFSYLVDSVYQSVITASLALDEEQAGLLLCNTPFYVFLIQHLHAQLLQQHAEQEGAEVAFSHLSERLMRTDWHAESASILTGVTASAPRKLARHVLRLHRNFVFNKHAGLAGSLKCFLGYDAMGFGPYSGLKSRFVEQEGLCLDNMSWGLFFAAYQEESVKEGSFTSLPEALSKTARDSLLTIKEVMASTFGLDWDLEGPATCLSAQLNTLWGLYQHAVSIRSLPEMMLANVSARPINKVIAHAFAMNGKRAYGFHHGNYIGPFSKGYTALNDIASYTDFIYPNKASRDYYFKIYSNSPLASCRPVNFQSIDVPIYEEMLQRNGQSSPPTSIETVMLMGYPMNAWRYAGTPYSYFQYHMDLELRLVASLRAAGKKVIYKVHPEHRNIAEAIFSPLCDSVEPAPFEETWQSADALLVKYTGTTTFDFALATNRPIILLDLEREYWDPHYYDLLTKRCMLIPAEEDSSGRLQYDEAALVEVLRKKAHCPDMTIVHEALLVEGQRSQDHARHA